MEKKEGQQASQPKEKPAKPAKLPTGQGGDSPANAASQSNRQTPPKVAVIMRQPMGGAGINYATGDEVLVLEEVATAWEGAQIAKIKKGEPSGDALVHPHQVPPGQPEIDSKDSDESGKDEDEKSEGGTP